MYPPSPQPLVPGATTRKYRPLPLRPSQSHDDRNVVSSPRLSYASIDHSAQRTNGSSPKASKRDGANVLPECENISDHTPQNGAKVENQALYHNQWKKLGFIGKGSYGQVYRALDITTGYIFAVKEVNSKIKRRTLVQALQAERETLRELEHPNIVRYLGFGEDQGILNIFLEYVPGGTIRSCLNTHGKFKEEVTKSFTSQILQGLSYLHSKSILHRDLKSENILVEPRGICKISDFGISKKALEADRGRLYSIMKGTIAYMAPEMIDNENKGYDSKIDVWSVGCIVFEMWTGKTPWSGSQDVQILMKLLSEKLAASPGPPLPDDISLSATAESFRQEFFHFDPEKRPSAVKLLQHVYLKLPPQWTFPGVEEMGQASDTSSESIALSNDIGTGTQISTKDQEDRDSISIYLDIKAIAAEINLATNHAQRSPSLARTMYSDVKNPQAFKPPLIPFTLPLKPRKRFNFSSLPVVAHTTTSPNTTSQTSPLNTSSDRRPYVYHPPPLPEMNVLSPYSRQLVSPISVRCRKPTTFSKHIQPVPTKLLTLSTDVSSGGISVTRPNLRKVDYSGQRGVPCILPPESVDDDDSDDDDRYSPSIWKRPPVDIPSKPSQCVKPVESVSDWNISSIHHHHHHPLPPSAIPRPSVETVYKGFLSENVENIDLPDSRVTRSVSGKRRYSMKSIRDVVEARLSQAQIIPATRAHFWNSHMEEI